jgi:hypothetical protein
VFSGGTTGATGTMTTTTQGVSTVAAPSIVPKISGKAFTNGGTLYDLGVAGTAISTTGTYVYLFSKNAGAAAAGITATFDTPIPKNMRLTVTHGNATSITYSVDYALCL